MLALLMAVSLHKAPTGVEVHRDGDAVRIERGDEVVLAEGDYVEVLAFGRLWVIDGTRVKDLPPMPAHGESKVLVNAMDKAAEAGCPVGVEQLSSVASTGALTVTLARTGSRSASSPSGFTPWTSPGTRALPRSPLS